MKMCFSPFGFSQAQNPYHNASLLEQSGLHRITLGTSTVSSVSSARYVNMQTLKHEFAVLRNPSNETMLTPRLERGQGSLGEVTPGGGKFPSPLKSCCVLWVSGGKMKMTV